MEPERYISDRDTLERITRLETKVCLRFEELDKALSLARENMERDRTERRNELDRRLEGMNQFQQRMDKLEGTFATKDEISAINRLVYIGVGLAIALQVALRMAN